MKVVFDTSVLLSAFIAEGLCAKLLMRARRRDVELFICPFILDEFVEKLTEKLHVLPVELRKLLALFAEGSRKVTPPAGAVARAQVCRDRDDDHLLACAKAAGATYLGSGDRDLLALENREGIRIVSPRTFEQLFV
ncbi:MAG: putative toxin-antitoxin system toxin component, PIN family [Nitrospirae bacterium CG2_30_70_394]|nr:putative toxin-antitoxin system toxin component, PIN family [Deltaproteobacteria bacterium]OIP66821.1 MAG: putative toxin-antitoxin system toxin component, PIN family [Nitrospirae bacterium CG2_30_70_394]PIU77379.1 MAG: putative toxin-antitoxin system toxin component, PIN family [Nitrospirae bacterium CG06_land_8_20_14_3_00_70_43]PJB94714.1 MAG: putative toxin-antitoxin system toxin component, PIN family [Nitrospirae bacterium CG_4_9_14_0_8_um_filter_70_14]HBB41355.1 putative toxin-antitoxin